MFRPYALIVSVLILTSTIAYAAQHVVGQKGRLFSPGVMRVKAGDTVVFKNDDTVTHHIYSSTKGRDFNLETMKPGQEGRKMFKLAGRVDIRCGLHPGMRLVVTVE